MASERQPTLEEVMSQSNSYMREGLEKAAPKRLAALRERLSRLDPEDPLHQSTVNDIVKLESLASDEIVAIGAPESEKIDILSDPEMGRVEYYRTLLKGPEKENSKQEINGRERIPGPQRIQGYIQRILDRIKFVRECASLDHRSAMTGDNFPGYNAALQNLGHARKALEKMVPLSANEWTDEQIQKYINERANVRRALQAIRDTAKNVPKTTPVEFSVPTETDEAPEEDENEVDVYTSAGIQQAKDDVAARYNTAQKSGLSQMQLALINGAHKKLVAELGRAERVVADGAELTIQQEGKLQKSYDDFVKVCEGTTATATKKPTEQPSDSATESLETGLTVDEYKLHMRPATIVRLAKGLGITTDEAEEIVEKSLDQIDFTDPNQAAKEAKRITENLEYRVKDEQAESRADEKAAKPDSKNFAPSNKRLSDAADSYELARNSESDPDEERHEQVKSRKQAENAEAMTKEFAEFAEIDETVQDSHYRYNRRVDGLRDHYQENEQFNELKSHYQENERFDKEREVARRTGDNKAGVKGGKTVESNQMPQERYQFTTGEDTPEAAKVREEIEKEFARSTGAPGRASEREGNIADNGSNQNIINIDIGDAVRKAMESGPPQAQTHPQFPGVYYMMLPGGFVPVMPVGPGNYPIGMPPMPGAQMQQIPDPRGGFWVYQPSEQGKQEGQEDQDGQNRKQEGSPEDTEKLKTEREVFVREIDEHIEELRELLGKISDDQGEQYKEGINNLVNSKREAFINDTKDDTSLTAEKLEQAKKAWQEFYKDSKKKLEEYIQQKSEEQAEGLKSDRDAFAAQIEEQVKKLQKRLQALPEDAWLRKQLERSLAKKKQEFTDSTKDENLTSESLQQAKDAWQAFYEDAVKQLDGDFSERFGSYEEGRKKWLETKRTFEGYFNERGEWIEGKKAKYLTNTKKNIKEWKQKLADTKYAKTPEGQQLAKRLEGLEKEYKEAKLARYKALQQVLELRAKRGLISEEGAKKVRATMAARIFGVKGEGDVGYRSDEQIKKRNEYMAEGKQFDARSDRERELEFEKETTPQKERNRLQRIAVPIWNGYRKLPKTVRYSIGGLAFGTATALTGGLTLAAGAGIGLRTLIGGTLGAGAGALLGRQAHTWRSKFIEQSKKERTTTRQTDLAAFDINDFDAVEAHLLAADKEVASQEKKQKYYAMGAALAGGAAVGGVAGAAPTEWIDSARDAAERAGDSVGVNKRMDQLTEWGRGVFGEETEVAPSLKPEASSPTPSPTDNVEPAREASGMKATGPEMHGNYPASEFPYADQSVDATGSETNAAHGGNTAPEAAVDPVAEGVPSTEQMVEIQKGGTISESFLEAWKAGEIEGLPGPGEMSTNEFLAKMYTAIHELDNNVAIMERMHISSNDLDLVHPGEDINLQPLIEHMQGKSLEEIANPVDLKIAPEVVEPVAADGQPVSETSASQPAGAPDTTAQPTAAESTPNGSESIYEKYPDMQFGAEALTAEQASRHPGVIAELSMRAGEGVTSELIQAREQLYAWLDPASHNAMYADNPVRALAEVRFSDLANNGTYLENVERALNARGLTMSSAGAENLANLVLKLDTAGLDGQQSLQGVLEKTLQNNFQSFTNEGGLRSIRMTFNDNPTLLTFKR